MDEKKSKGKKVFDIITWVLFILSFVPYLLLVKAAFFGANVGLFTPNIAYGFSAVYTLICYLTIVPIFPVCLGYEIIYALIMFRKFGKIRKIMTIAIPVTIAVLVVVPCTVYSVVSNYKDKNYYAEHEEKVWSYLRDNFSDEILENGKLTLKSRETGCFWLRLDKGLFDGIYYIDVHIDKDGTITDDFAKNFSDGNLDTKEFAEEFGSYLDELYGVDANEDLQATIYDVDMRDFSYQDDVSELFSKCEYEVTSVYFTVEQYNQDAIISSIKDFYKNIFPQLPRRDSRTFNYYVIQDDNFYASIHSFDKNLDDNVLTLFFEGYTYTSEEGPTIPSFDVDVTLD